MIAAGLNSWLLFSNRRNSASSTIGLEEVESVKSSDLKNEQSDTPDGSIISFHGLNYQLSPHGWIRRLPLPFRKKNSPKILDNVSGVFQPGMNAILGPTGSGKSSLLDILADRKGRRGIHGSIWINGQPRSADFKYHVGYVAQDDIVSGTLTVRENLTFSANIRLPESVSHEEKTAIVNSVIEQLGLTKCADSRVGDEYQRGISGGERRRTNIGLELVLSPRVLFLDEPTTGKSTGPLRFWSACSGLDSATARNVIKYLHRLSKKNREYWELVQLSYEWSSCWILDTIILSIHQPQYSIFKLFDRVFLLAAGHCIYHGSVNEMLPYFNSIGYRCEEHDNPADFILDVCQGDRQPIVNTDQREDDSSRVRDHVVTDLTNTYAKSSIFASMQEYIIEQLGALGKRRSSDLPHIPKSHKMELFYVSQRTLRTTFRNPAILVMQIAVPMFLAILIGILFWKIQLPYDSGTRNRLGVIFFIVANQVFGNLSALEIFIKERVLFTHEIASGYYRVSTYFLSKLFCDLLPMRIIPSILFSVIVYFMIGFQVSAAKFFVFFLGIFATVICASSLCFFISASVRVFGRGSLCVSFDRCVFSLLARRGKSLGSDILHAHLVVYRSIRYFILGYPCSVVDSMAEHLSLCLQPLCNQWTDWLAVGRVSRREELHARRRNFKRTKHRLWNLMGSLEELCRIARHNCNISSLRLRSTASNEKDGWIEIYHTEDVFFSRSCHMVRHARVKIPIASQRLNEFVSREDHLLRKNHSMLQREGQPWSVAKMCVVTVYAERCSRKKSIFLLIEVVLSEHKYAVNRSTDPWAQICHWLPWDIPNPHIPESKFVRTVNFLRLQWEPLKTSVAWKITRRSCLVASSVTLIAVPMKTALAEANVSASGGRFGKQLHAWARSMTRDEKSNVTTSVDRASMLDGNQDDRDRSNSKRFLWVYIGEIRDWRHASLDDRCTNRKHHHVFCSTLRNRHTCLEWLFRSSVSFPTSPIQSNFS